MNGGNFDAAQKPIAEHMFTLRHQARIWSKNLEDATRVL